MNSGGFGRRMFMGKPGVYARKEISPTTEVHIPVLQAIFCCVILLLDALFILSWGLILPVGIIYVTSMIAITILAPVLVGGLFFGFRAMLGWFKIFPYVLRVMLSPVRVPWFCIRDVVAWVEKFLSTHKEEEWPSIFNLYQRINKFIPSLPIIDELYQRIDEFLSDLPASIEKHWTTIAIAVAMLTFFITGATFVVRHNAWHDICVSLPHVDLPLPHVGGYSEPAIGLFLALVGIIGFAFKPNRYSLGMTAFGGIVTAALQYFRPITVKVTYGWTLPLYAVWGAICFAWLVGTATLTIRFWLRELLEYSDYGIQRAPDPLENALLDPENRSGRGGQEGY